jgi:hypothetical protein
MSKRLATKAGSRRQKRRLDASDLLAIQNNRDMNGLRDTDVLAWTSPRGESVLEYLWRSQHPYAMTTLLIIVERYTLNRVVRYMKDPFVFLDLLFTDPSLAKNANSVAMAQRRSVIYDILEQGPMSDVEFRTVFQLDTKRGTKRLQSFVATQPAYMSKTPRPEYRKHFITTMGESFPGLLLSAGRTIPMPYPPLVHFPKAYLRNAKRKATIDMLAASLTYDHPEESRALAIQIIAETPRYTPLPMGPWSLSVALEVAVLRRDRAMVSRTVALIHYLARLGVQFTEWRWDLAGYNVLHLAILYGEVDMAMEIAGLGIDPRYPFVYDTDPKSGKPIHMRRRVIPTMDLVHHLESAGAASKAKIEALTETLTKMAAFHRRHDRTMGIRSPSHRERVSKWTTGKYRAIQDKRRGGFRESRLKAWITRVLKKPQFELLTENLNPRNMATSESVNNAVAQHMRDHALRAPQMPREMSWRHVTTPTVLYRGVHGPIAAELRKHGKYVDHGFVATSYRTEVASMFKKRRGIMLEFPIDSIPKGTPWIWFSPSAQPQSNTVMSWCDESEVLLPPGTYTLGPKIGKNVYRATYTPLPDARSLRGKKITRS